MKWKIAIDGPAGAGKSTIAKKIAEKLNFEYIDTGAMYRAITLKALSLKVNLELEESYKFIENTDITFVNNNIYLDGKDVSCEIRSIEVTNNVSLVSKFKIVRDKLVDLQQKIAESKNIIMDGRDIGTVVLPNADLKIFLEANSSERAKRRMLERENSGINNLSLDETIREIEERDAKDSKRKISPLAKADDAIEIDTSHMSISEVVEKIISLFVKRGFKMEDVKQVNETAAEEVVVEEKATEEVVNDAATEEVVESAINEETQTVKEMQLVEGTVIEVLPAENERKTKDGKVIKAKEARVLVQIDNGPEGLLFKKDVAGVEDDEDLFDEFLEGDRVQLVVKKVFENGGKVLLSQVLVEKRQGLTKYEEIINNHGTIVAKVEKSVPVGLILNHEGYSCLLPTSQIDGEQSALEVGTEIEVAPIRVDKNRVRLIVSQKVANAINGRKQKAVFVETVKVGNEYEGVVKNIEPYGAFIEIGQGVEGLLHISEIEHNRIIRVDKVLKTGDTVKVKVIKVDEGHIGLSRKALMPNYWNEYVENNEMGSVVKGTVAEINNAGVVVDLNDKVQGFLPKSEFSWARDTFVEDYLEKGQEVEAKIIELDAAKRRIILSRKQLIADPWQTLTLKSGDEVKCVVVKVLPQGVKVDIDGANGFLPNNNFGEKTEFTKGETIMAKVRVFDVEKQKLFITMREEVARPERNVEKNEYSKYMKSREKATGTLADFINLDDYE